MTAGGADVVMDLTPAAHSSGGVRRYLTGLAGGLAGLAARGDLRFRTLDVPAARPGTPGPGFQADLTLENPLYTRIPVLRRIPLRLGSELRSRPGRLGRLTGGSGVFHHSGVQPACPAERTSVLTLFDLSPWQHPEWHTTDTVEYAHRERLLIASGSSLLAISSWAAGEAVAWFGLGGEAVGVAGGAADDIYSPGEPDPSVLLAHGLTRDRYLLHVGSFVPRKNIPFLLEVFSGCVSGGLDLELVLVGAESWGDSAVPEARSARRLAVPDDRDLLHIYRGARAVLLPSEYEGLGLPALEAMACGTPLVSSSAAALAETVGGGGLLLDPGDAAAWAEAMSALGGEDLPRRLRGMALAAPRRRWLDAAADAVRFYGGLAR